MVVEDNPVLARRYRGGSLESIHRGCWVVVDADGEIIAGAGAPDQPIFPRSASKSMQALAALDLGIVERFGLTDEHVAVMIASHNGERVHERVVASLLDAAGLDADVLRCGHAAPFGDANVTRRRITHNCSGKHAGFLAGTVALGEHPSSYLDPDGAMQRLVQTAVCEVAGLVEGEWHLATDGCSAPTFVMPLRALGRGIARVAAPDTLPAPAARFAPACDLIANAAAAHPHLVAGSAPPRFDTALMRATGGRLFAKGGADGVQVIGIRGAGLAFAAKIDDGSARALEPLAIEVLDRLGHLEAGERAALHGFDDATVRNADGLAVGEQVLADTGW